MVAMSGAIIPEPLAMPFIVTARPSISARAVASFGKVSVVTMASAAAAQPSAESPPYRSGSAARILPTGRGSPITPVEETKVSSAVQPTRPEAEAAVRAVASAPALPVKALALPELTTSARARPRAATARE